MPDLEARVENAISRTLADVGRWVPLSVRRCAAQAAVAVVREWDEAGDGPEVTGCCARDGIDCVSCMTGRCFECLDCIHGPRYDDSARDDEDE